MSRHSMYEGRRDIPERPWKIHPIWRGIGCILLILIPIISFLGAYLLVQEEIIRDLGIPYPIEFATVLLSFTFMGTVYSVDWMTLIITGFLILLGFAVLMIFYSIVYSALGPPRYGPLDAKAERPKRRKKLKSKR